jgi:hypothetical protein
MSKGTGGERARRESLQDVEIKIGDKVRDRLSGLVGYVHGKAEYITGCNQVLVNPRTVKDDKPVDGTWIDDSRIELVESLSTPETHDRGGPAVAENAGLRTA